MSRKIFLASKVIMLAVTLVFAGYQQAPAPAAALAPASAPVAAGTIKIGHIRPLTGSMSMVGQRMVQAAQFAFEEANYQVAGKKVEVIVEDDAGQPEMAIDKVRKLVEKDKVALVIGPTTGGPLMAVSDFCNKVGIINIHTNPSPPGVIMQKHRWTLQVGGAEPQLPSCMARYSYEQLGVKKIIVISVDSAPGHGFLDAFTGTFKKLGGRVIQEQYAPIGTPDYAPYLAAAKDADACISWFDGVSTISFLTQYEEMGLWKRMPIIPAFHGSFFVPFMVDRLPPKAAAPIFGRVVPTPYSSLLDTPINKKFVEAYVKRWKVTPDDSITQTYGGALLALTALKATGGDTTPEKLRQALLDAQIEAPDGPIRFDKEKQSAIRNVYIAKIDKVAKETVWTVVYTYKDVPPLGY
jgi:branched-chain amino acid transport system substrate-binding protein